MNKNVVGIIIIVLAIALVGFYAYPKLKLHFSTPQVEPAKPGQTPEPNI